MRKYTKKERLEIANVFRLARNKLWNGKATVPMNKKRGICFCIDDTLANFRFEAKEIVRNRLGNYLYVSEFLKSNGIKNFSKLFQ